MLHFELHWRGGSPPSQLPHPHRSQVSLGQTGGLVIRKEKIEKHQQPQQENLIKSLLCHQALYIFFSMVRSSSTKSSSPPVRHLFRTSRNPRLAYVFLTPEKVASPLHLGAERSESSRAAPACLSQKAARHSMAAEVRRCQLVGNDSSATGLFCSLATNSSTADVSFCAMRCSSLHDSRLSPKYFRRLRFEI